MNIQEIPAFFDQLNQELTEKYYTPCPCQDTLKKELKIGPRDITVLMNIETRGYPEGFQHHIVVAISPEDPEVEAAIHSCSQRIAAGYMNFQKSPVSN